MGGMYPNNQDVEIFGEQVSWPGVDASGKFTNGSFSDPMVKPSFIPADTVNLILDNLESLIRACGGVPNATGPDQLRNAMLNRLERGDADTLAAARALSEDIIPPLSVGNSDVGRSLLDVFRVSNVADAMEEIRRRCNNGGEIDGSKIPDFRGMRIGDYLDLATLDDGTTVYRWHEDYKNLRVVVSGFNFYKHHGDTENTENHVLFTFRNCVTTRQMNSGDTNAGGYPASELRKYLEGVFALGLKQALGGGDCLYTIRHVMSNKDGHAWYTDTVFLPSEREVWGWTAFGSPWKDGAVPGQYPVYISTIYKTKRNNGSRTYWWNTTRREEDASSFCAVCFRGIPTYLDASSVFGVAPAFCVR